MNDFSKTAVYGCMGSCVSLIGLLMFVLSLKGMM